MSAEDLEKYETEVELNLYREYRPVRRLAKNIKVLTFKDVNVAELSHSEIEPPKA